MRPARRESSRASRKRATDMRLTSVVLAAALAAAAPPALAQDAPPHLVVREVVREVVRSEKSGAYQGRDRGAEQSDRFSRRVKLGRDGRVTVGNISGSIVITGGSGDEVTIEA